MRVPKPVALDQARVHRSASLIPDFLWPWIGLLIGALTAVAVVFALLTTGDVGPRRFEQDIIDWFHRSEIPSRVFSAGLVPGSPVFFAAVVVALAIWAVARRSWPALVACATVPGAVLLVEQILKPLVDRHSELDSVLYYPSGTAAGVAAWTTLAWLLAMPVVRRTAARWALTLVLAAVTAFTAVSVVGSDKHLPLDAVGGVAVGMGVVLACAAIIDLVTGAHRPPTREPDSFRGASPL